MNDASQAGPAEGATAPPRDGAAKDEAAPPQASARKESLIPRRLLVRLGIAVAGLAALAIAALAVFIVATSAPALPPAPLPTATAQPAAGPELQVQALVASGQGVALAATALAYQGPHRDGALGAPCDGSGHWSLVVNPQGVMGHPYPAPPTAAEWARAVGVAGVAAAICPAPLVLTWFAHEPAHPSSDRWMATVAVPLPNGGAGTLQRLAQRHARQA